MTTTALPDASSGTGATQTSETEAQFKAFVVAVRDALASMGDPMAKFGVRQNLSLALSVAGNALTIALKDRAGADADRDLGQVLRGGGAVQERDRRHRRLQHPQRAGGRLAGGELGLDARHGREPAFRLWIVAFNDAGTFRLGVINCVSHAAGAGAGRDITSIYPLRAWGIGTSTAEGGAGAADSAQTFYTGTAVAAKAFAVLGYATWETGLATPGTWSAGPTRTQLFGAGEPLPGDILQVQRTDTGAVATGTTTIPNDDTFPQSTEGDQYMSQAITPSSAANALRARAQAVLANSGSANFHLAIALFQDATANALAAARQLVGLAGFDEVVALEKLMLAGTTSATTLKAAAARTSPAPPPSTARPARASGRRDELVPRGGRGDGVKGEP
jgi:hypothetical protein